jgi:hypothetical protein
VEAVVQQRAVAQLHNALKHLPEWAMDTCADGEFIRASFYKKRDGACCEP